MTATRVRLTNVETSETIDVVLNGTRKRPLRTDDDNDGEEGVVVVQDDHLGIGKRFLKQHFRRARRSSINWDNVPGLDDTAQIRLRVVATGIEIAFVGNVNGTSATARQVNNSNGKEEDGAETIIERGGDVVVATAVAKFSLLGQLYTFRLAIINDTAAPAAIAAASAAPAVAKGKQPQKQAAPPAPAAAAAAEEAADDGKWKFTADRAITYFGAPGKGEKVASFDLDDTLVTPKSGKTFAQDGNDWQFLYANVPARLQQAAAEGYRLVIFTNQGGVEKGQTTLAAVHQRLSAVMAAVGVPMEAYAAIGSESSLTRKPNTAMWKLMDSRRAVPQRQQSVFVGDAAGRLKDWAPGRKKDFSCSDRKFAANCGVRFETPEEYFRGDPPTAATKWSWDGLTPEALQAKVAEFRQLQQQQPDAAKRLADYRQRYVRTDGAQELVLTVGPPGVGKSFFASEVLGSTYGRVNQDTLKTKDKCLREAETLLRQGRSVVVDNTNGDPDVRQQYFAVARRCGVGHIRCLHFVDSVDFAQHMNNFRAITGERDAVPQIGYNMFKSKYVAPTMAEGFEAVLTVSFVPFFADEARVELFAQLS